jgi:hypothetical protein
VSLLFESRSTATQNDAWRQLLWPVLEEKKSVINATVLNHQEADFSALMPHNRNYHRYVASRSTPPCDAGVTYIVFDEPGAISVTGTGLIRAALGLPVPDTAFVVDAQGTPPSASRGNCRPLAGPQTWVNASDAPRRFVDFVGDSHYDARPDTVALNENLDMMAILALVLSCVSVFFALVATRIAQA